MAGTIAGGKLAAKSNKERHGESFYKDIGKLGGVVKSPKKGFGSNRERASIAGARGGAISRRPKRV